MAMRNEEEPNQAAMVMSSEEELNQATMAMSSKGRAEPSHNSDEQ
jgi:hypothetical protein